MLPPARSRSAYSETSIGHTLELSEAEVRFALDWLGSHPRRLVEADTQAEGQVDAAGNDQVG